MDRSKTPNFYEMGGQEKFQDFCRDLHGEQEGIATCHEYGTRGQSQKGIDHIAYCKDVKFIEVGQAKHYKDFDENEISKACDKFYEYLDYWKGQDASKFVLIVSHELSRRECQKEILKQRKRFQDENIQFEVWSNSEIRKRLRPHRALAEQYIDSYDLIDQICGKQIENQQISQSDIRLAELNDSAKNEQRIILSDAYSKSIDRQLEEIRDHFRSGNQVGAFTEVSELRSHDNWSLFEKPLQAKILRILALYTIHIDKNDKVAEALLAESISIDPDGNNFALSFTIANERGDRVKAKELAASSNTVQGKNLFAAILLEEGLLDEAINTLNTFPDGLTKNAESLKFESLAHLLKGNANKARLLIADALKEKPDWYFLKLDAAIIDYLLGVSSNIPKPQHLTYPPLIAGDLVKKDSESLAMVRNAEAIFLSLLDAGISEHEKHKVELWHFAALSSDPDKQNESEALGKELLEKYHGDAFLTAALTSRGISIDVNMISRRFENNLQEIKKDPRTFSNSIFLLLDNDEHEKAKRALTHSEDLFKANGWLDKWNYLMAHVLIEESEYEKAINIAEKISDEDTKRHVTITVSREKYRKHGELEPFVEALEKAYETTGDSFYIWELCQVKYKNKDLGYILERSDELLRKVSTPSAVQVIANSAYEAKKTNLCLETLENNLALFPNSRLPGYLEALRISCLSLLGRISEALQSAKKIADLDPTPENLFMLARVQHSEGDLKGLKETGLKLLTFEKPPADFLLQLSDLVRLEDKEIAIVLWMKAEEQIETNDDMTGIVVFAFTLGQSLDIQSERLSKRFNKLDVSKIPEVKLLDFQSLKKMVIDAGKKQEKELTLYDKGKLPIHLLAHYSDVHITSHFTSPLKNKDKGFAPLTDARIYIRHGSRGFKGILPAQFPNCSVILDVTSILLAYSLGIYETIKSLCTKVYIAPTTIPLLVEERKKLDHHQPSRYLLLKEGLKLIDLNIIKIIGTEDLETFSEIYLKNVNPELNQLFGKSSESGAYILDILPIKSNKDQSILDLSIKLHSKIICISGIIEALYINGSISDEVYSNANIQNKEEYDFVEYFTLPPKGSDIYLSIGTLDFLNDLGLLQASCTYFTLHILQSEADQMKNYLNQREAFNQDAELLNKIIKTLNKDIESNTILILTIENPEENSNTGTHHMGINSLNELIRSKISDSVLIVDDRLFNSSPITVNRIPIYGIPDILSYLRDIGKIDDETFFLHLIKLRQGNYRFLPLSKDEILHNLSKAEVIDGRVVETEGLLVLRKYLSACLLDEDSLQISPDTVSGSHERTFIAESTLAINNAISGCWQNGKSERTIAKSDWILENLYFGLPGIRHLTPEDDQTSDRLDQVGFEFSSLIVSAVTLSVKDDVNGD